MGNENENNKLKKKTINCENTIKVNQLYCHNKSVFLSRKKTIFQLENGKAMEVLTEEQFILDQKEDYFILLSLQVQKGI